MVYRNEISDTDWLKLELIDCWTQLRPDILNRVTGQLPNRWTTVIKAKGAHDEFRLSKSVFR